MSDKNSQQFSPVNMEGLQQNGDANQQQQIDNHIQDIRRSYPSQVNENPDEDAMSRQQMKQQQIQQKKNAFATQKGKTRSEQPKLRQQNKQTKQKITGIKNQNDNVPVVIKQSNQALPIVNQPQAQNIPSNNAKITFSIRQPSPNRYYSNTQSIPIISRNVTPPKNTILSNFAAPQQHLVSAVQPIQMIPAHQNIIRSRIISESQRPPVILHINAKPQSTVVNRSDFINLPVGAMPGSYSRIVQNNSMIAQPQRNIRHESSSARVLPGNFTQRQISPSQKIIANQSKITINNHMPTYTHSRFIENNTNEHSGNYTGPVFHTSHINNYNNAYATNINANINLVRPLSPVSPSVVSIPSLHLSPHPSFSSSINQVQVNNNIRGNGIPIVHHQNSNNNINITIPVRTQSVQPQPSVPILIPIPSSQSQQSQAHSTQASLIQSIPQTIHILSQYDHIASQIHSINTYTTTVNVMINQMLRSQREPQKQQFINKLMIQYTRVINKLNQMEKQMQSINQQNAHVRDILALTRSYESQVQENTGNLQNFNHQVQKTVSTQEVQKLNKKLQALQKQYNKLQQKYENLQQHSTFQPTLSHEQQLQKQIQGQKAIIKKLQQQLIMQSNKNILISNTNSSNTNANVAIKNTTSLSQSLEREKQKKNNESQSKFMAIIQSKQAYINELEAETIRYKTQIKSLKQQIIKQRNQKAGTLTGEEEGRVAQEIAKQVRNMQKSLSNNSDSPLLAKSIEKLNVALKQKDEQMDLLKQKLFQMQDEFDLTIDQKDRKIKELHQQIINIQQKLSKQKNQQLEQQKILNEKLQHQIQEKQYEQKSLKQLTQKNKLLQKQVQSLKTQKVGLSQSLKMRVEQQEKLKQTLNQLESRLKNASKGQQIKIMIQTMKKKQNQLTKLRQTIQLHLTTIDQLENKMTALEQQQNNLQKGQLHQKHILQKKYVELEKQMWQLKEQQKQKMNQSEHHKNQKHQLKHTIKQLQKRIKILEQYQAMYNNSNSLPPEGRQSQKPDFRQHYSQSQVKLFEMQNTIKNKDTKIRQLQSAIQTLRLKINHNSGNQQQFIMNQQIEALRRKIADYQSGRTNPQNGLDKFNSLKNRDYQSNSLFEHRVIYNLKSQNQRLRAMIGHTNWDNSHKDIHKETKKSSKKQHTAVTAIQQRLFQFNVKLEQLIAYNHQIEYNSPSPTKSKSNKNHNKYIDVQNPEMFSLLQREKIAIVKRYNREIQNLQSRIVDLQRYCSQLEYFNSSYNYSLVEVNTGKSEQKNIYADQLVYYKNKNKELQDRVDSLLMLNKQLKDKLQHYMRPQGKHNLQYYKQQNSQLSSRISDLQNRMRIIEEQRSKLRRQLQKSRNDKTYTSKIQTMQAKIQQLNIKLLKAEQQNDHLNSQLKKYTQQVIDSSSQSLNYKTLVHEYELKIQNLEMMNKSSGSKIWQFETQITKMSNQIQLLKAEIQRLQQQTKSKKKQYQSEVAALKSKILQLQQQMRDNQSKFSERDHDRNNKDQTINSLNLKIIALEANYKNEVDKVSILNQRIRQLQYKINEIQGTQSYIKGANNELESLLQQKNQQILFIAKQLSQSRIQNDVLSQKNSRLQQRIMELQQSLQRVKQQLAQSQKQNGQSLNILNQNDQLNKKILGLQQRISQLQMQLQKSRQNQSIQFWIQTIRSIYIQIQVLISLVSQQKQQKQIISRIVVEIQKGLNACSQIYAKINTTKLVFRS